MENNDNNFLGRLDERTKSIQLILEKMEGDLRSQNDSINKKIDFSEMRMTKRIEDLENELEKNYVRKDHFTPVQKIVYGLVGLVLVSVVGAVLATVINKPR